MQLALKHKCLDKAAFGLKNANTARRLSDLEQKIASASDRPPGKRDKSTAATGGQGRDPCESHCDEYHNCFGIQKATQRRKETLIGVQYWAATRRLGMAVREYPVASLDNSMLSLPANDRCIRGCVLLPKTSWAFCGKMRGFRNSYKTRSRFARKCRDLRGIVKLSL